MKKLAILIICPILFWSCAPTGMLYQFSTTDYSSIDPKYLIDAHSTVRESNIELIVHDPSTATYRKREAITIHDQEHADFSVIRVEYDKLSKVEYINARLINSSGEVIRTYSMKDAMDFSQYDRVSFFSDNRVKIIEAYSNNYPYTIEYEYQTKLFGTLNLPGWYPVFPDQSVEKSSFTIIDQGTGVRTHSVNFEPDVYSENQIAGTLSMWTYNDHPAQENEPYSSIIENIPYMLVSPGNFEIGGSYGDASNWEAFGKWYYDLGSETRVLPEEAKKEIDALVSGITDEHEIVAILFNYLQEKNRYVSIQLGIGGWKPFTAEFVYNNSYGDCKALTNYMLAALEYVGIRADAVLINASDSRPLIEEFPGNQFNHVVLRVVLESGEEIWLECTSKYLPPNNLGDGYSKKALLVTKEGGQIVDTPDLTYRDNSQVSIYNLVITEGGKTQVNGELQYTGANQARILHNLLPVSESEKVKWLKDQLEGDQITVRNADFTGVSSNSQNANVQFQADFGNYVSQSARRLFVPVNKLNRWRWNFERDNDRTLPIRFLFPFFESDSLRIEVPTGYEIESFPTIAESTNEFAEFRSELVKLSDNAFLFKRTFKMKEKEIPADRYEELRAFLNEVRRADAQQLVLVRSDS